MTALNYVRHLFETVFADANGYQGHALPPPSGTATRPHRHPPHLWGLMHWRMFRCFAPQRHPFVIASTHSLVTDEVLHPIGKVQPLLIGLNVPDQVESSLTGGIFLIRWNLIDEV